ncbi:FAD-binding oxidoreductase [Ramlibacter henchirensis]|uniref:FAD-binding oxidoreductase n=1 Tax=Ramlibacter henchirensis TaxID=204072 RepID=A0A4Z0C280_9BURK|nr:FAD-binding oxidoreductase [Ramlibacter henchirensis]TFZ05636.1 FAD-binding oxidoreductase [Ramlibacter henchirensis]
MRLESFWTDTAAAFDGRSDELPANADAVVVGGGFTGLSAARRLAMRGAKVVVLEAGAVAAEASGRNGGHVNNGLALDYATVAARVGRERASAWYRAYDAAVDTVERLVREENIDCGFERRGKLKLASRAPHFDQLSRSFEQLRREADPDVELLSAAAVRDEIGSDRFAGAVLYRKSAQMHMGRFGRALAEAAARRGALIYDHTPVERLQRLRGSAYRVHTRRGAIEADQVLLATGATRVGAFSSFSFWRRRIVPIGSFIIVTEPLDAAAVRALLPQRRTYTTTDTLHNYFRVTPDNRLVFGGRARFALSSPRSDARSGHVLREQLVALFPALRDTRIDYCWGGIVDMTQDRLPHAGEEDGLFYSMGYSGHGTQMSVHMGECMARVMAGDVTANPWRDNPWPAIPGHFGPPWFLPAVGVYFRIKNRFA